MTVLAASLVAALYRDACRFDVLAAKPGNVSITAAGHGMTARDFLASARVTAPLVARRGAGVGTAIREAVEATWAAVGCNTNLGIVLLAVPLAQAAQRATPGDLRVRLAQVLAGLDLRDAAEAFRAISLAKPAGLGRVGAEDVGAPPTQGLRAAMALAAERDRIAWNYVHDYADVFELGVPALRESLAREDSLCAAVVAASLRFMAALPDSHVSRKLGAEVAARVQRRATEVESLYKACEDPDARLRLAEAFDGELKRGSVNPGTTADLTVTSLFAMNLAAALEEAR
jgi:triphosphoribosyl-dephospho-CoA synthase